MSTLLDKLTALEEQIDSLRSKVEHLSDRSENLGRLAKTLTEQTQNFDRETTALCGEMSQARSELDAVLSLLAEVRTEGIQTGTKEDENRLLHETLTSMFGETFQVVSRFLETAKKLGVVDDDKAVGIMKAGESLPSNEKESEAAIEVEEPEVDAKPMADEPNPLAAEAGTEEPEPVTVEAVTGDVPSFADLTDADFEPTETASDDVSALSLPSLPDVLTPPEALPEAEAEEESTEEPLPDDSAEMASQLDLPPLQLDIPAVSDTEVSTDEEQKIEDLLTDLSKPIST